MSPSIAVITDTDSSLPPDVAQRYGIRQVPISVHFGEETFKTGVDIDDARVFERVDREDRLPTTSAPSPGDFIAAYREAMEAGADSIVCICISSEASGTYNAARTACDVVPECDIAVIDSRTMSMAQGFMVLAAAEAAQTGATKEEVIQAARSVGERVHLYAALSTLKYLAMSGRVGHIAAGMAGLLNIRPILTIQDGELDLLEKVRTRRKAWGRVMELTGESLDGRCAERMAVIHVNAPEEARQFEQLLREKVACPEEILISELTPGLSVHAGSGIVGVVFVADA